MKIMCPECKARRDAARKALMDREIKEATKHVALGVAEMVGLKPKSAIAEPQVEIEQNPGDARATPDGHKRQGA